MVQPRAPVPPVEKIWFWQSASENRLSCHAEEVDKKAKVAAETYVRRMVIGLLLLRTTGVPNCGIGFRKT